MLSLSLRLSLLSYYSYVVFAGQPFFETASDQAEYVVRD